MRKISVETIKSFAGNFLYHDTTYLLPYKEVVVEALIKENKFYQNSRAAFVLAKVLEDWLANKSGEIVIIPIPLGKKRQRTRGYNQVTEILKKLPLSEKYSTSPDLLHRNTETLPQTDLQRTERLKNIIGAFSCSEITSLENYSGKTLVIVDDVVTTGSTLEVARATLAPHFPPETKIICLALAH